MSASRSDMNSDSNSKPSRIAAAKSATRCVFVRNLETLAHIGVHGHEQGKAQPIRINVDLGVADTPIVEDRLDAVGDYEAVTLAIRATVAKGHFNPAETLPHPTPPPSLDARRVP